VTSVSFWRTAAEEGLVTTSDGERRAVVLVVDNGVEVTIWRPGPGAAPDLGTVDALARMQLAARRMGWSIRFDNPCERLRALLQLTGLADLLLEPGREAEGGEQLGVDEAVVPGDRPT